MSYYEQKTFWSLCSYMVRSRKGIEMLVNLINISYIIGKFSELSYDTKKPLRWDRTAAERNYVAKATRRRRRIPRAGFFFIVQ